MLLDYKIDKQQRLVYDKIIDGRRCCIRAKTEKELLRKYKSWLADVAAGKAEEEKGPLFETVALAWWDDVQARVKRGTITCYRPRYQDCLQYFRGVRIRDIDVADITEYLRNLSRQGYAAKTAGNAKIVLSQIFQFWMNSLEWRGDKNPVTYARLPSGMSRTKRTMPDDSIIEKMKARTDGLGLLANLIIYTGIRLGEANAVQVKDIDFTRNVYGITGGIYISKAYPWRGNEPYLETTKTEAGVRWVPIFAPLVPILQAAVSGLDADDYLISQAPTPLTKMQFQRRWQSYCRSIGCAHEKSVQTNKLLSNGQPMLRTEWVADVTPHQLRHYLASMCYEAQVPELVAQKILGHADIATTHKVYTHIRDQMMSASAASLNSLFTQTSRKQ